MSQLLRAGSTGAALLFATAAAIAQPQAVLLEACNGIADAARRLECFKAAMAAGAGRSEGAASNASLEPLARALVGLQGSLSTGTNLISYRASLDSVARELAIYEREAPIDRAAGLRKVKQALEVYSDVERLWSADIEFFARRDNRIAFMNGLPYGLVGLEWLVKKYDLTTGRADLLGFNSGLNTANAMQSLWGRAKVAADEGLLALKDPASAARAEENAKAAARLEGARVIANLTLKPALAKGVEVLAVADGTLSDVKVGDFIIRVSGQRIYTLDDVAAALEAALAADGMAVVGVLRGEEEFQLRYRGK